MWEEPRPERMRRDEDSVSSLLWGLLVASTLVGGFAVLLTTGLPNLFRTPASPPGSDRPLVTPARPPASGPASPAFDYPLQPPPSPRPQVYAPASRGDARVLQSLTETCRYWTEQNTRGQYNGNQQMACTKMSSYAEEYGMTVPFVAGQGPSLPAQRSAPRMAPGVYVDECDRHGQGSIPYRQCRAAEQQRLDSSCRSLRTQLDSATGARRDTLRRQAQAVCSEASRYQIVR
jgi:hypothetical protein